MRQSVLVFFIIHVLVFYSGAFAQESKDLWLCPFPPKEYKGKVKPSGMQKFYALPGKYGKEKFVLWPAIGNSLVNVSYLDSLPNLETQIFLFSPQGKQEKYKLSKGKTGFSFVYDFGEEGYHNVYILQKYTDNNELFIHVAKAERLSHKCSNGHKGVQKKIYPKTFPDFIPFEITRERIKKGENFHIMLESGNKTTFKVLYNGEPVKGAIVEFISNQDWKKSAITNEKGKVTFQILSDYFPNLREVKREKISYFQINAQFTIDEEGEYQGIKYKKINYSCSMPGDYIPAPSLYKSYFWAVLVILLTILILSIAIYIHRRKTQRYY